MIVKPMLAKDAPADLSVLSYPQIVQPKFDGIRAMVVDGVLVSRTAKPIRNDEIQAALGRREFDGLDGELLVGSPTAPDAMQRTSEFVMSSSKTGAAWAYYVFDSHSVPGPYHERQAALLNRIERGWAWDAVHMVLVPWPVAACPEDVALLEARYVNEGYEGAILRDPRAPYKHGRSGTRGPLLKVKRFADSEAVVIGAEERQHNQNEAKRDAFGRTERSTAKDGKVPAGDLGALICRTPEGVEFKIGTGYTAALRKALWAEHQQALTPSGSSLIGRIAKYKHFEVGVKTAPRFPVFLGFRDPDDLDPLFAATDNPE